MSDAVEGWKEATAALRAQVADLKHWREQDKAAAVELFKRVREHLDAFLEYCEGGDLPSEIRAKYLWVDVNDACDDAVDHSETASSD